METKEVKIQVPEGYEIDKENSTFECVKFKPIKKDITYKDICNKLFIKNKIGFYITDSGITDSNIINCYAENKNNATNRKQLEKLLALNQLLNIAEYYNRLHSMIDKSYVILYDKRTQDYTINSIPLWYRFGVEVCFNNKEDAQAVIDNPNFREILDTIYK